MWVVGAGSLSEGRSDAEDRVRGRMCVVRVMRMTRGAEEGVMVMVDVVADQGRGAVVVYQAAEHPAHAHAAEGEAGHAADGCVTVAGVSHSVAVDHRLNVTLLQLASLLALLALFCPAILEPDLHLSL